MSAIPKSVTETQFARYIEPSLSTARRGPVCKVPLYVVFNLILYRLNTGCQWTRVPSEGLSWQAVYYHYRKWSADGSLRRVWEASSAAVKDELDVSCLNLDGTHTPAKKGGESVAYQRRKRAKTSNLLVLVEAKGYVLAASPLIAGNHHDAFELVPTVKPMVKTLKPLALPIHKAPLNADSAFDTKALRRFCFNHQLVPNIAANARNQQAPKRGRKRLFDPLIYKKRFCIARTFAWLDAFRALLVRMDRSDTYFLAACHLAFALLNFRHLFARLP